MIKKIYFMFVVCTLFLAVKSTSLYAAGGWYVTQVVQVGANSSGVVIKLTDAGGAFTNMWFILDPNKQDQYLATALTALSLDKKLTVQALDISADFKMLTGAFVSK